MQVRDRLGRWLHGLANKVGNTHYGGITASATLSVTTPDIRPTECSIEPSEPYASDWLGREQFGSGLELLTRYGSGSGVVLIDGDWGTGKTTFIRMWLASLRNDDRTVVEVNAWAGDHADAPFDDIVRQFERGLRHCHRPLAKWSRRIGWIMRRSVSVAASSASWLSGLPGAVDENAIGAIAKLIHDLQRATKAGRRSDKRISRLRRRLNAAADYYWKRRHKSIVLVIDELDRCRPDYALRFLETIKHIFEVPHVTFVITANAQELAKAVKGVYGDNFDGQAYIERFFDIRLPLPVGDRRQFVGRCLAERSFNAASGEAILYSLDERSVTAAQLARDLLIASRLSPRQIKKAIQHIAITLLFNRSDSAELARAIVFLGLVRHCAPESYHTNPEQVGSTLLEEMVASSPSWSADDARTAETGLAVAKLVWSNPESCLAARQALEGSAAGRNEQSSARENRVDPATEPGT